nr:unnamed protein product [Mus musculus]
MFHFPLKICENVSTTTTPARETFGKQRFSSRSRFCHPGRHLASSGVDLGRLSPPRRFPLADSDPWEDSRSGGFSRRALCRHPVVTEENAAVVTGDTEILFYSFLRLSLTARRCLRMCEP